MVLNEKIKRRARVRSQVACDDVDDGDDDFTCNVFPRRLNVVICDKVEIKIMNFPSPTQSPFALVAGMEN
jgi:hypothetical protein